MDYKTDIIKIEKSFKFTTADGFSENIIKQSNKSIKSENYEVRTPYLNDDIDQKTTKLTPKIKFEVEEENGDKKYIAMVNKNYVKQENSKFQILKNELTLIKTKEKPECEDDNYVDDKPPINDDDSTLNDPPSEEFKQNEKIYNCVHCAYSTSLRRRLVEHMRSHFNKGSFTCAYCNYKATRKTTLKKHIFNLHFPKNYDNVQLYKCVTCDASYKHQYSLIKHIRRHETNLEAGCKCNICSFSSSNPYILNNHVLTHSKKKLKCDNCEKVFSRTDVLNHHKIMSHTTKDIFKCQSCHREYTTKIGLEKHQLKSCARYECKICKKEFPYKCLLTTHMERHTGKYTFECSTCAKGFSTHTHLIYHTKSHSGEFRFKCTLCNFTTNRKNTMMTHEAMHNKTSIYNFPDCKFVTNRNKLGQTLRKKQSTAKKFECAHCDYYTSIRISIIHHLQSHLLQ